MRAERTLPGTSIEGGPIRQKREAAGKVFVVEDATVAYHRPYLAREERPNEPTGMPRRDTHGEQAIVGGANLGRPSAPKLQRNQLPHLP